MSTPTSGLESGEDLDNIPLVRLADVQPSRVSTYVDNPTEAEEKSAVHFEYVETVSANEDSNGGSISLHSEVVDTDDDSGSGEVIVPEYIPDELPMDIPTTQTTQEPKANQPGSWPTLEILPGGVIKRAEKDDEDADGGDMMYACAKCPERFKLLFSLVKHVRWHEDERKREQGEDLTKLSRLEKELISIKRARFDAEKKYKKQKSEVMSRIAEAIGGLGDLSDITI